MFCVVIFKRRAQKPRTGMDNRNATDARGQQAGRFLSVSQYNELDVYPRESDPVDPSEQAFVIT
jgi:hypothetical protein